MLYTGRAQLLGTIWQADICRSGADRARYLTRRVDATAIGINAFRVAQAKHFAHDLGSFGGAGQGLADALLDNAFVDAQLAFSVGKRRMAPVKKRHAFVGQCEGVAALPEVGEQATTKVKTQEPS